MRLLLIAPVWNRNSISEKSLAISRALLIAPVWNRNDNTPLPNVNPGGLLIAPVWNRNLALPTHWIVCSPFNRTSVE